MASRYRISTVLGVVDVVADEFGVDIEAVESDNPDVLDAVVANAVAQYVDDDMWRAGEYVVNAPREIAMRLADEWDGVMEVLEEDEASEESQGEEVSF